MVDTPAKTIFVINKKIVWIVLLFLFSVPPFLYKRMNGEAAEETGSLALNIALDYVKDGDTIVAGGEKIRYAGIDTPEFNEPFFEEAKKRNIALLKGKEVKIIVCEEQSRDKYGRLLAWVYAGSIDVSAVLLREGLARVLTIPPCGLKKQKEYRAYEKEAKVNKRGIWGIRQGTR